MCVWGEELPRHYISLIHQTAVLCYFWKKKKEIIQFLSFSNLPHAPSSLSLSTTAVASGCLKAPTVHNSDSLNDGWLSPWRPDQSVTMPVADLWQLFIFICSARHLASLVPLRCTASLLLTPFSLFQMHSHNPVFSPIWVITLPEDSGTEVSLSWTFLFTQGRKKRHLKVMGKSAEMRTIQD